MYRSAVLGGMPNFWAVRLWRYGQNQAAGCRNTAGGFVFSLLAFRYWLVARFERLLRCAAKELSRLSGLTESRHLRKQRALKCCHCLKCEARKVSWQCEMLSALNGGQRRQYQARTGQNIVVELHRNRHIRTDFVIYCSVQSNKEWHKCGDVDDCIGITYQIVPNE